MTILVVEDDPRLSLLICRGLREAGHIVERAIDGVAGFDLVTDGAYDVVIMDVMLPELDGFEVVKRLRAAGNRTPVLFLTARDTVEDVVRGLDAGGDDYLAKPFVFDELEARLRSVTRRSSMTAAPDLRVGDVTFDPIERRARRGQRVLTLTARETAFLEYFLRHPVQLITRRMLEDALWNRADERLSNVVDVYVARLRVQLEAEGEPRLLKTVRGAGYRFEAT